MSKKINKDIYELIVQGPLAHTGLEDILSNLFVRVGIPWDQLVEYREGPRLSICTFFRSRKSAYAVLKRIHRLNLKSVSAKINLLRQGDWQNRWKKDIKPFELTKHIDVVPLWHKSDDRPKKKKIVYIDTAMAFGTGLHETTRFVAQLIEQCQGRFDSFLDIGTGTGILAMVAFQCFAKKVCAIDIDPASIKVARKNLSLNRFTGVQLIVVDVKDFKPQKQFDFVVANLITYDLILLKYKICALVRPGGLLAVSGVSLRNLSWLKKEFKTLPLRCLTILKGQQWVGILYKKFSKNN